MSGYPCTSRELSHYIVQYCTKREKPVSNLQLQKIMYFLQVVYCKKSGSLLFEEQFEAWPYGPVLPKVYREYSSYGGSAIVEIYSDLDISGFISIQSFIDNGVDFLAAKSPWELVRLSHADGAPWSVIWDEGKGSHSVIPNQLILETYAKGVRR